jgi:hypothetical protein
MAEIDYKEVKRAIESERELMAFMVKLDARKWEDLMQLSREMARMRSAEAEAGAQKAQAEAKARTDSERLRAQADVAKSQEQEKTRRQASAQEHAAEMERQKVQREKDLIDYRVRGDSCKRNLSDGLCQVKKDLEAEQERSQMRLKAENAASENIARKEKTEKDLVEYRLKREVETEAEKTKQRVLAGKHTWNVMECSRRCRAEREQADEGTAGVGACACRAKSVCKGSSRFGAREEASSAQTRAGAEKARAHKGLGFEKGEGGIAMLE